MRKLFLLLIPAFLVAGTTQAQNVGIGTSTPTEKLEVKNAGTSSIKISSNSNLDTSQLILSNRTASQGTDFLIKNIREQGLFIASRSDLPLNNSANSLVVSPTGNIGVGISPAATNKFHVNGVSNFNGLLKIENTNFLEFGAGISGKELNAGRIGYNAFGLNALSIVGAGTSTANRQIFLFAEGGTTQGGPLNLLGPLRLNGNQGTAGQILTSNGAGVPQWSASAFGNQVRFAARFNCSDAAFPPTPTVTYTTEYNQSPADITIGTNDITINKSGLYHIQGFARYIIDYSGNPQPTNNPYADLTFFLGSTAFTPAQTEPIGFTKNSFFQKSIPFSQDYYIAAPATIRVYATIGAFQTNYTRIESSGIITGYLISE